MSAPAGIAGRRARLLAIITAVLAAGALLAWWTPGKDHPDFTRPALVFSDPRLQHPGDIVYFQGRYVVTEIYNNRLAILDGLPPKTVEYFEPESIGERFRSPHFLTVTPDDTLLISNGWGRSIVEIKALDGSGWTEFSGADSGFNAPHGVCIDDGWIYVGDSLNSRLVRFRDMTGTDWQVFDDVDNRVSYVRELVCQDGEVWVSNSYETRPGLNPGRGANLLRIADFESGKVEVVYAFPDTNITGVLPLGGRDVLVGQWGNRRRLSVVDRRRTSEDEFPRSPLGTPYGMSLDDTGRNVIVSHIGDLDANDRGNRGGLALYK